MNKIFLFILLLLFIPLAQADPSATSYSGYVTFDGTTKPNASVTVLDSSGNTVASATSISDATYQVTVPWDEASTTQTDEGVVSGETITFKVGGRTATSRVIDPKGSSIRLDLVATSSSTSSGSSSGGSSSGGGGGGGGGSSGENTSNIEVIEKYDLQISKDVITSYKFTNKKNPIMFVNITGNTNMGIITASLEVLKTTSTLVNTPPEGLVYMYANIWVGTSGFATPKNIKEALIKFRVDNSWMNSNGVSGSDIALMRWDGSRWIKLETKELSKEDAYTYFEAKTNAFSPFAISGFKGTIVATASPEVTTVTTEEQEATPSPTKKAPGFDPLLAIVGLIISVLRKRSE